MKVKVGDVGIQNSKEDIWKMCAFPRLFISVAVLLLRKLFISFQHLIIDYSILHFVTALQDNASCVAAHTWFPIFTRTSLEHPASRTKEWREILQNRTHISVCVPHLAYRISRVVYCRYRHTSEILQIRFQITAIKRVTRMFWFRCAYKSYVYTSP
jgi:hypothetical protein